MNGTALLGTQIHFFVKFKQHRQKTCFYGGQSPLNAELFSRSIGVLNGNISRGLTGNKETLKTI